MAVIALDLPSAGPTRAGVLAMAPMVLAYAPFALIIGSTVATVDEPVAGWAGSWLILGGSAHLAALQGIAGGGALLAIATALLVNTRLLVYGMSMAPRWREQPRWFRLLAPALLIDPTWALAARQATAGKHLTPVEERQFFLATGLTLGAGWSATMGIGALLGDRLPDIGLELAAPLCLIALVAVRLRDREHRAAAVGAAIVALMTTTWPGGAGTAAAIAAGVVAAQLGDRKQP